MKIHSTGGTDRDFTLFGANQDDLPEDCTEIALYSYTETLFTTSYPKLLFPITEVHAFR